MMKAMLALEQWFAAHLAQTSGGIDGKTAAA